MYEVVEFNTVLAQATANVIYGRPDLWDRISKHDALDDALAAGVKILKTGDIGIRRIGDRYNLWRNYYIKEAFVLLKELRRQRPGMPDDEMIKAINMAIYDIYEDELFYATADKKVSHVLSKMHEN